LHEQVIYSVSPITIQSVRAIFRLQLVAAGEVIEGQRCAVHSGMQGTDATKGHLPERWNRGTISEPNQKP